MRSITPSKRIFSHPILSQPFISLGLTSLSLLLLVLILLSVPGPIKSLYWFSIKTEDGESLSAGALGWCMSNTSNCTYAPLSDNPNLSKLINTGQALLVRTILPLACYWMIVTFLIWIGLTVLIPIEGYKIQNLDSIIRHMRFAILESFVLCMSLFGNILSWLAYGLSRNAFESIKRGGGKPKSGNAMETTAIASFISLLSLLFAIWGLHLRLTSAQKQWKQEAVMVRRRSMALCANGVVNPENADVLGERDESKLEKRLSTVSRDSFRLNGVHNGAAGGLENRSSIYKAPINLRHTKDNNLHPDRILGMKVKARSKSRNI
ncbi:hypothetical protein I302_104349 [Kwoniella bestiolae CBS 10118]|uniref:Uncharacterized protein n=1 Tax=Kwoniella bestiolae CBS 10118 TaxID=1296100 RepID=A0A1B9GB11_9TREE|nr:hypothetical protein I302_03057 [Kwoniella bestiolae CBS 10118]OCF28205.1 hypothetical protein I302_03057 [Kwoniella bestiolae CBS 10118]